MEKLALQIQAFLRRPQCVPDALSVKQLGLTLDKEIIGKLQQRAKSKKIYFIRHAESQLNAWKAASEANMFATPPDSLNDPKITAIGQQQCNDFKNKHGQLILDALFVSPYVRTMQTAATLLRIKAITSKQIIQTHLIRQRSVLRPGVVGSLPPSQFVTKARWWRNDSVEDDMKGLKMQSKKDYNARMSLFVLWIIARPQQRIGVVGHGCIYDWLFNSKIGLIPNVCLQQLEYQHITGILDRASL